MLAVEKLKVWVWWLAIWISGLSHAAARQTDQPPPPNIILINLDDADRECFSSQILAKYLPNFNHLATQGIRLTNCHVTTPLCGPSRACLLRGQYAHRTGIRTNRAKERQNNGFSGGFQLFLDRGYESEHLGCWMQRAGYRTMMVGKYAHGPVNPKQVKGWNDLHISFGGDYFGANIYDSRLPADRRRFHSDKSLYRTSQETEAAVAMLDRQTKRGAGGSRSQPFFLYLAPLAPHKPAANGKMLPTELAQLGIDIRLFSSPDLNELDVTDKPAHLQVDRLADKEIQAMHQEHRHRIISLISVDRLIQQILDTLRKHDLLENTFIFLTSDNGFQLGHNRMTAKKLPFDRNTNVPMLILGPGIKANSSASHLVAHIDLAPTFLELAGAKSPIDSDGKSIVSILRDPKSVDARRFRKSLLIENWESKYHPSGPLLATYSSMRSFKTIYTEWSNGSREFYDLEKDPFQLNNSYEKLAGKIQQRLSAQLRELKSGLDEPLVTLASEGQISRQPALHGFAEDDDGIGEVLVEVINRADGNYLATESWRASPVTMNAELKNQNGLLSAWRLNLNLGEIDTGSPIEVRIRSRNLQGQLSDEIRAEFQIDDVEPKTELQNPLDGSVIHSPLNILGTATDDHEVQQVELVLQRIDDGRFWNGNGWSSRHSRIKKRIFRNEKNWKYRIDIPKGRYRLSARAVDGAGNIDSSPAEHHFSIN